MKRNLVLFIFIFFCLIFSSFGFTIDSYSHPTFNPIWTDYNEHDPGLTRVSVGIDLVIGNNGEDIVRDVEWTSNAFSENGKIVFGDGVHGRIPAIDPGEEHVIPLRPLPLFYTDAYGRSPIGFGSISLSANAMTSTGDSAQVEKTGFLFGPFLILGVSK